MIEKLDDLVFPDSKGGMDASGYKLHEIAEQLNGKHTTTQEAFDRIYGGNCDYIEAQGGVSVPDLLRCDGSFVQDRSKVLPS